MSDVDRARSLHGNEQPSLRPCVNPPAQLKPGKALRLGVISNPLSGGNRRGLGGIRDVLNRCPNTYHFEASTPSEIGLVLAELAKRRVDLLAVNGGDGTIQAVLTELFRSSASEPVPVLALLRSGTTSMIAWDVGLRGSPKRALDKLLVWVETGYGRHNVVQRPVLKVDRGPGQQPLYGMFFGAAGICQGIRFCHEHVYTKGLRGELAAGLTLLRFLMAAASGNRGLSPVPIAIGLDKGPMEQRDFLLIFISSLERLFLGLRPYWGSEIAPLCYTAIDAHPKHLLKALPALVRGYESRFCKAKNGYFSRNVIEARLAFTGAFALDGELFPVDTQLGCVIVKEGGKASFLRL